MENSTIIFGQHYFLSSHRKVYVYQVYDWSSVFAKLGGFGHILIIVFGIIGFASNERALIAKQIRNLYFVKQKSKNQDISPRHKITTEEMVETMSIIKFNFKYKLLNMKRICCRKKKVSAIKNRNEFILNIAEDKLY